MKKLSSLFLLAALVLALVAGLVSCGEKNNVETIDTPYKGTTLHVYNWGENIANGEDGSMNLEAMFEKIYGIDVVYTTYAITEVPSDNYPMGMIVDLARDINLSAVKGGYDYSVPVAAGQQLLHCRQHQFFTAGAVTELHIQ